MRGQQRDKERERTECWSAVCKARMPPPPPGALSTHLVALLVLHRGAQHHHGLVTARLGGRRRLCRRRLQGCGRGHGRVRRVRRLPHARLPGHLWRNPALRRLTLTTLLLLRCTALLLLGAAKAARRAAASRGAARLQAWRQAAAVLVLLAQSAGEAVARADMVFWLLLAPLTPPLGLPGAADGTAETMWRVPRRPCCPPPPLAPGYVSRSTPQGPGPEC